MRQKKGVTAAQKSRIDTFELLRQLDADYGHEPNDCPACGQSPCVLLRSVTNYLLGMQLVDGNAFVARTNLVTIKLDVETHLSWSNKQHLLVGAKPKVTVDNSIVTEVEVKSVEHPQRQFIPDPIPSRPLDVEDTVERQAYYE